MKEGEEGWETYTPEVVQAREFLEIVRDFTDPKEAIREAISNSLDWGADEIRIEVDEDRGRPDEELVIRIRDNGVGIDRERLQAFFDLGRTTALTEDDSSRPVPWKIGYKGHGTKVYFNSRVIELISQSRETAIHAIMDSPLQKLMADQIPKYRANIVTESREDTFTEVVLRGYNMNHNKRDFGHKVLRDYIAWFTRFGSVEGEFGLSGNEHQVLFLKGLGRDSPERIAFGHVFPKENSKIGRLIRERPGDWTKVFVKKWLSKNRPIVDHPGKSIDMVFYLEGDEAKRSYNRMIRVRGKPREYGMYKVEERYGLWACKDYMPIKRHNDWLGLGKRLETKYHAFVNCQDFRLTANRGDIGNTPPDLLAAIQETVQQIFEGEIIGSPEYQEYDEAAELEQQYQTARQEKKDFKRRQKRAKTKKVCQFRGIELIEPAIEMGVISLFNLVYAHQPALFPFRIIDYDTRRGYDALVAHRTPFNLSEASMSFIEFKYMLSHRFNHSFNHLISIVCWACKLADGEEVRDIEDKRRHLRILPANEENDYTRYMLTSPRERHNIEVFVLKEYLREKLELEFRRRSTKESDA